MAQSVRLDELGAGYLDISKYVMWLSGQSK